jgi:dihydroneopterin aldolase
MSDLIKISGISGFGFHGVFEEERTNGQYFFVDIELYANLQNLEDKLENTINYATIAELVKSEIESNPVNLIETLAERIAKKILKDESKISRVLVTIHKPNAPVSVKVKDISVTVDKSR